MSEPAILQSLAPLLTRLPGMTGAELDPASVVQHPDPGLEPSRADLTERRLSVMESEGEISLTDLLVLQAEGEAQRVPVGAVR